MLKTIKLFFFENETTGQTFLKNTFWLFVAEMGVRLIKLSLFIYAARTLGILEWGAFSYAMALMSVFAIISDIGVNSVLIREKARNINYQQFISTGFLMKIALSALAGILLLVYALFLKDVNAIKALLPFMAILLFLDSMREFGFTLNRAFEKMELEAFGKIFTTLLLVIVGLLLIKNLGTALSLSYAYIISSTVGVLIGYYFLRQELNPVRKNFNKKLILELWREAWPLGLVSVFGVILTNIDTVILGWYRSISMVGIYAVAQKPIQLINIIPPLLGIALLPIFSRLALEDPDKMRTMITRSLYLILYIALPLTLVSIIFGKFIILLLFGTDYIGAVVPFQITSTALVFSAPGLIISNALFAFGKQKITTIAIALGVFVNFVLSFILIPQTGLIGAALATTIAQIVSNIVIIGYAQKIGILSKKASPIK